MRRCAPPLMLLCLATQAPLAHPTVLDTVELHCEAVYMPARSPWAREVQIRFDDQRVRSVTIDGQPVFTFSVRGQTLLTALDNERIQIDLAGMRWTSDFRGLASSQGNCLRSN